MSDEFELFRREMEAIAANNDWGEEIRHVCADGLMCDKLRELGYGAAIDIFEGMHKWYA